MLRWVVCAVLLAAAGAPARDQAILLYDQGRYAEARIAIEKLDAAGEADGPMLYRLFFCARSAGDEAAAQRALDRARKALEPANVEPASLDIPFYLANTYSNMGRSADAQAVAKAATARVEAKTIPVPETGIGWFQIGKLYQDQGRQAEALSYYDKALAAFELAGARYTGSARWALRYIGSVAAARKDFAGAARAFERLAALEGASAADWRQLAEARVRAGLFEEASAAWKEAIRLDPSEADDPRYASRLAAAAVPLAPLPTAAPGGRAYSAMTREELEAAMKAAAARAREIRTRAVDAMRPESEGGPPRTLDPALREESTRNLRAVRSEFVAAGLEYALKGLPIRETAFHEGFAVLIFQDTEWELPADEAPPS